GDCLRVYSDGFDVSRIEKTKFITEFLTERFPTHKWTLKVCFNRSGKNCGVCRKCVRTINDIYIVNANPNDFGFKTSINETKQNLLKCLEEIEQETKMHQELEAYFLNGSLKYIEQHNLAKENSYCSWLYDLLINKPFIIDIRQRNSNYYSNLQNELE